jgi:hypothetical protein
MSRDTTPSRGGSSRLGQIAAAAAIGTSIRTSCRQGLPYERTFDRVTVFECADGGG